MGTMLTVKSLKNSEDMGDYARPKKERIQIQNQMVKSIKRFSEEMLQSSNQNITRIQQKLFGQTNWEKVRITKLNSTEKGVRNGRPSSRNQHAADLERVIGLCIHHKILLRCENKMYYKEKTYLSSVLRQNYTIIPESGRGVKCTAFFLQPGEDKSIKQA